MFEPLADTMIVGLGHKARHGKDTVASLLAKDLSALYGPGSVQRHSFADDLYAVARVQYGMTKKDGKLLQILGTEIFRRMDPDVWVRSLYWKLAEKCPRVCIIADVRFPNEAAFIKQMGGHLVKVTRKNKDGSLWVTTDRDPNHPSEVSLDGYDGWDYEIVAEDGNIAALVSGAAKLAGIVAGVRV